jgi:hypothetical protein
MQEHWPPRVANWLPKFDAILFSALKPIQGHKSSAFISKLGQIEKFFFSISALDS